MTESNSTRWWTLGPDDAARSITATLDVLKSASAARHAEYTVGERLYGNSVTAMPATGASSSTLPKHWTDQIAQNVVQSVVDTIVSKFVKNKPRPNFLTDDGNNAQQRKAKKLNKFVDGVFYETHTYDADPQVVRDACVWGDAFTKVLERDGRIAHERTMPRELYVDDREALYGYPRSLHQERLVDRAVLADTYPRAAAKIKAADPVSTRLAGGRGGESDMILVRESWHLPSGKDAKDGKNIVTIDGHALTPMYPWEMDRFPFARFRWAPRHTGYWAQGCASRLQGKQLYLNKLQLLTYRSLHLGGTFKVLMEAGSKIVEEKITNEIGATIRYSGQKPEYVVPPLVQPEIYAERERVIREAYEQEGVSQLSAGSVKPAGLDSKPSLREYSDIESDRFQAPGREWEQYHLSLAELDIATARRIAKREGGTYKVKAPGRGSVFTVDWSEADLEPDAYVMQCFPVSSLPRDPAGRLQTVQEYAQAGYLQPQQARRLLDFPDIAQDESLANAEEDWLIEVFDRIVIDGEFTPPDNFDNLNRARELALQYYAKGKMHDLNPERMELLERYMKQIAHVEKKRAEAAAAEAAALTPPAAPGMPLAPPVPMEPSPLVPNVPIQ